MKVESTFPLLRLLLRLPSPPHSLVSLAFSLSRLSSALPPSRFFPSPLNTMDTITLLPLLSQSLSSDPQTRRNAERQLANHEAAPGFLLSVLSIVQGAGEAPMEIRLAGGIYFKNAVRKMWAEVSQIDFVACPGAGRQPTQWRLTIIAVSRDFVFLQRRSSAKGHAYLTVGRQ